MNQPVILVAREPRGRFGRVVKSGFWIFQALMLAVTLGTCAAVIPFTGSDDPEVAAGAAMFGFTTLGIAWSVWPVGSILLGILLLATRGRRRLVQLPAERPAAMPAHVQTGVGGILRTPRAAGSVPQTTPRAGGSVPQTTPPAAANPEPPADSAPNP